MHSFVTAALTVATLVAGMLVPAAPAVAAPAVAPPAVAAPAVAATGRASVPVCSQHADRAHAKPRLLSLRANGQHVTARVSLARPVHGTVRGVIRRGTSRSRMHVVARARRAGGRVVYTLRGTLPAAIARVIDVRIGLAGREGRLTDAIERSLHLLP